MEALATAKQFVDADAVEDCDLRTEVLDLLCQDGAPLFDLIPVTYLLDEKGMQRNLCEEEFSTC